MSHNKSKVPPWVQGPYEIIRHADEHLTLGGDTDRHIALIGFDNAIEICIDVFITLHPTVRGVEISKNEIEKAKINYHTKLEFFYNFVKNMGTQVNIPIENVVWYHQLRNGLYHSGNGLVPEKHAILGAQAAAYLIFEILFRMKLGELSDWQEKPSEKPISKKLTADEIDEWLKLFREK